MNHLAPSAFALCVISLLAGCSPGPDSAVGEPATTSAPSTMRETSMPQVTFRGNPVTLEGRPPEVGAPAPDFVAVANDLSEKRLSDYKGKTVLLVTVPSLDTPVCDTETRKFNERAAELPGDAVVLTVSMDLPFAQKRWCAASGVDSVVTLSDYKDRQVGAAYGLRLKELGLLARTVWVIDPQGKIRYREIVPEIASEPNYDAALAAAAD